MLLSAEHIVVEFAAGRRQKVHAVSDVTFGLDEGETLGLVGESGCGKSTLARTVMQLPRPTSGAVRVAGRELTALGGKALREARRDVQMVFQDPISSLNPRRRVFDLVAEPLAIAGVSDGRRHRVSAALEAVGLTTEVIDAYPHQLSGGQCQRV